ncbi:hypothetical protein HNQ51_002119 [Inhella inkyongensis]|uniref:SH3b domain-containing protein n=1 Tax=Inhella inkyongensis TaxID=392593 RepID=A0A840S397_9BURK|nr:SH3 domain-containing protein [Inhella inkyongensis]MBB5204805.1 hypothetical protein [Inhella inkyongensis]
MLTRACALLLLSAGLLGLAHAAPPPSLQRWVRADDLRVREGPGPEQRVLGLLQRGSRLQLLEQSGDYCLVEGEGQYGHVACEYLSTEPVAWPRAGQGDVPADRRWVVGAAVTLRAGPQRESEAIGRLALNQAVQWRAQAEGGNAGRNAASNAGYCEVQPLDRAGLPQGEPGFTACQYLAAEPLRVAALLGGVAGSESPADRARAFWLRPSWPALRDYAQALASKLPPGFSGPWPVDAELERMKAHLALGLKGPKPEPLPDWEALKRLAAAAAQALPLPEQQPDAQQAAARLREVLGLDGAHALGLVQALELPRVSPSYFRSELELAPPSEAAPALAGRFEGIYRVQFRKRPLREESGAGLYDMTSRTEALTRAVTRVQLFREGRLESQASHARAQETLWYEVDGPMCEGWRGGFAHGSSPPSAWKFFDLVDVNGGARKAREQAEHRQAPGRLYAFYTAKPLPLAQAVRTEQAHKLDRQATGFVRATQLSYDLDADGVPDLQVWEGVGRGPGHLGAAPQTDDAWYRLVWVNIQGAWKVLGVDAFDYGCGC